MPPGPKTARLWSSLVTLEFPAAVTQVQALSFMLAMIAKRGLMDQPDNYEGEMLFPVAADDPQPIEQPEPFSPPPSEPMLRPDDGGTIG